MAIRIRYVQPNQSATAGGGVVRVITAGAGATPGTGLIGVTPATIDTWTDGYVDVVLPGKSAGTYSLRLIAADATEDILDAAIVYADPGTPILTLAEAQLKTLIEDMSIATGYFFNWGTSTNPDEAAGTDLASLIEPVNPFEINKDNPYGAHSGAYLNECQYRVTVRPKLTSEQTLPNWEVRAFWHKAVDDLKKRFGLDDGSTLNGTVQHFAYMRTLQYIERAGDVFKPGRIEVYFRCMYHQDRADPSVNA